MGETGYQHGRGFGGKPISPLLGDTPSMSTLITPQPNRLLDRIDSQNDVIRFYRNAIEQLSNAVYGEETAKDEAVSAMVDGGALMLSGYPGGGKSVLSEVLPYLVQGVGSRNIALISGQNDLRATQLVGGVVESVKSIESEDTREVTRQRIATTIAGIFNSSTRFGRVEEANRVNPFALNSILPIVENHRLETSVGEVDLPDFYTVVFTQNPSDVGQSTFDISDALASRIRHGAVMGMKGDEEARLARIKGVRTLKRARIAQLGPNGRPRDMVHPIVTDAGMVALKGWVFDTAVSSGTEDKIDRVSIKVSDYLTDNEIVLETDGRISEQVMQNAKTLATLRNEGRSVGARDIRDATRSVVASRLGSLQKTDHLDLETLLDEWV